MLDYAGEKMDGQELILIRESIVGKRVRSILTREQAVGKKISKDSRKKIDDGEKSEKMEFYREINSCDGNEDL